MSISTPWVSHWAKSCQCKPGLQTRVGISDGAEQKFGPAEKVHKVGGNEIILFLSRRHFHELSKKIAQKIHLELKDPFWSFITMNYTKSNIVCNIFILFPLQWVRIDYHYLKSMDALRVASVSL